MTPACAAGVVYIEALTLHSPTSLSVSCHGRCSANPLLAAIRQVMDALFLLEVKVPLNVFWPFLTRSRP